MYRFKRFTEKAGVALNGAIDAARELGHTYVGTEHLVLGLLREGSGVAAVALASRGVTALRYARRLMEVENGGARSVLTPDDFTPRAIAAMESALTQAAMARQRYAGTEHILAAILRDDSSVAVRLLQQLDVRPADLLNDLSRAAGACSPTADTQPLSGKVRTPMLEQFGKDLTRLAAAGELDPVVGREEEISRVIQILCRRTKNNPCLIGEPGVGKTAVAEGLARRIVDGQVPSALLDKRLVTLDLTSMVAGTKYRGDFEERVKNTVSEVCKAGDVLLFIDEIHNLIGTGAAEGAVDAANILKPLLARGELQLVGATTVEEYRRHIEKDAALERRFQPVTVEEPTAEQTLEILRGLRERYESHHGVQVPEEALQAAVTLSVRYIPDRFLPDKAIDLMDEAAARVRLQQGPCAAALPTSRDLEEETRRAVHNGDFERAFRLQEDCKRLHNEKTVWSADPATDAVAVTAADVAAVVALWTGLPAEQITREEQLQLQQLEERLHHRLVGQEEAVRAVARAVRRSRVGLQDPDRPAGSFIFLGPTGVGKTRLCKALAEVLFGDEKALIRLDMSEYMEQHTVSRLIGSPPGYVGHEEGGQLTEQLRRHPYAVVLLDEIEKAHPDVFNLLLQILEDGRLTDAKGRRADFRHALVIMTSNVGAREIAGDNRVGFGERQVDAARQRAAAMGELKKLLSPELLNRVDEVIVFRSLDEAEVERIAGQMLERLAARLEAMGYRCRVEPTVATVLAREGYDRVYGARPLRRALQSRVEDVLAEQLLEGQYDKGDTITVSVRDGEICCGKAMCEA